MERWVSFNLIALRFFWLTRNEHHNMVSGLEIQEVL